jgi:hypothetical protein
MTVLALTKGAGLEPVETGAADAADVVLLFE